MLCEDVLNPAHNRVRTTRASTQHHTNQSIQNHPTTTSDSPSYSISSIRQQPFLFSNDVLNIYYCQSLLTLLYCLSNASPTSLSNAITSTMVAERYPIVEVFPIHYFLPSSASLHMNRLPSSTSNSRPTLHPCNPT